MKNKLIQNLTKTHKSWHTLCFVPRQQTEEENAMTTNTTDTRVELNDMDTTNTDVTGGFICKITLRRGIRTPHIATSRMSLGRSLEKVRPPRTVAWGQ
jgi:hypothetical protein